MEHRAYSPEDARREIADAMERADDLGQAIAEQIAEAERELEEIRHGPAFSAARGAPARSPIRS